MDAVLADWRIAPVSDKLRAMLAFLEKMNRDALGPEDAAAVRAAGVSEEAIDDAVYVAAAFNTIVRLADAFEFEVQTDAEFAGTAKMLLSRGYIL